MSTAASNHCITINDLETIIPYSTCFVGYNFLGKKSLFNACYTSGPFIESLYSLNNTYPMSAISLLDDGSYTYNYGNNCLSIGMADALFGGGFTYANLSSSTSSTPLTSNTLSSANTLGPFKFTPKSRHNNRQELLSYSDITVNTTFSLHCYISTGSAGVGFGATRTVQICFGPYDTSTGTLYKEYEMGGSASFSNEGTTKSFNITTVPNYTALLNRSDKANLKTYVALYQNGNYDRNGQYALYLKSDNGVFAGGDYSSNVFNFAKKDWIFGYFDQLPFLEFLSVWGWYKRFDSNTSNINNYFYLRWKFD
jgi:hypothetical protein